MEEKLTKLQAFDSSCSRGNSHSEDDGTQNYLVLQLVHKYTKTVINANKVSV